MFLNLEIEVTGDVEKELQRSLEDVTAEIVKTVAEDAPEEMRKLIGAGETSRRGEPPADRSGRLRASLKGQVVSPTEAEIEMADYAQYLDQLLGGDLDRPFIEEGINRSLRRAVSDEL